MSELRQPHILIEIYFLPSHLHFLHPIYLFCILTPTLPNAWKGNGICKAQYLSGLAKQATDNFMLFLWKTSLTRTLFLSGTHKFQVGTRTFLRVISANCNFSLHLPFMSKPFWAFAIGWITGPTRRAIRQFSAQSVICGFRCLSTIAIALWRWIHQVEEMKYRHIFFFPCQNKWEAKIQEKIPEMQGSLSSAHMTTWRWKTSSC